MKILFLLIMDVIIVIIVVIIEESDMYFVVNKRVKNIIVNIVKIIGE